jgi:hypothetical protein
VIEQVFYAIALTATGWATWVRRGTWRIPLESSTTAASLMLGLDRMHYNRLVARAALSRWAVQKRALVT